MPVNISHHHIYFLGSIVMPHYWTFPVQRHLCISVINCIGESSTDKWHWTPVRFMWTQGIAGWYYGGLLLWEDKFTDYKETGRWWGIHTLYIHGVFLYEIMFGNLLTWTVVRYYIILEKLFFLSKKEGNWWVDDISTFLEHVFFFFFFFIMGVTWYTLL